MPTRIGLVGKPSSQTHYGCTQDTPLPIVLPRLRYVIIIAFSSQTIRIIDNQVTNVSINMKSTKKAPNEHVL